MEIRAPLRRGLLNGLSITFMMVKVIVPCYIAIEIVKYLGVIDTIGSVCKPFMRLFGLPGEAALALVAGYLINMYAAIAVITPLHLATKDITVIALMLGICHSVTVETPVTKRTGVNAFPLLLVRLFLSLIAGAVLNLLWKLF
jgi:spore maturation protein SpmB